jgi:uncharacterized protein (TIGR03492 family)
MAGAHQGEDLARALSRILLLSNGHGEDLSASLIGRELRDRGHIVEALPLVGTGQAYRRAGIPVLGRHRDYSTGGLGYTSWHGRLTELLQGQLLYLLSQVRLMLRRAGSYRLLVVVGDVIPVMAAWLSRRPVITYLVAYSSHYEGRLRLPWPCGPCLRSPRTRRLYCRDALTAADLSGQLKRPAIFLGNPFLDPVTPGPGTSARRDAATACLALLPGSRLPEAERNLAEMLAVLEGLPQDLPLTCRAALVSDLDPPRLQGLTRRSRWQLEQDGSHWQLRHGARRLQLCWGAFAAVLHQSDLVLSMTGTAAEQAVGLGRPVLQVLGHGPQFTGSFADAQRRLLGPTVTCAPGEAGSERHHRATARRVLELLDQLGDGETSELARRCRTMARERIGPPGGSRRMAEDIDAVLHGPDLG